VKELRRYIEELKDVSNRIEKLKGKLEDLAMLQWEAVKSLSKASKSESEAQHEKSHLLEFYGAIILSLEEEFQKLCG